MKFEFISFRFGHVELIIALQRMTEECRNKQECIAWIHTFLYIRCLKRNSVFIDLQRLPDRGLICVLPDRLQDECGGRGVYPFQQDPLNLLQFGLLWEDRTRKRDVTSTTTTTTTRLTTKDGYANLTLIWNRCMLVPTSTTKTHEQIGFTATDLGCRFVTVHTDFRVGIPFM